MYLSGWDLSGTNSWGGSGAASKALSTPISAGTTHHAVLVLNGTATGTTGTITGYVDGRPFGQFDGVGQLTAHSEGAIIGQVGGSTMYYDGPSSATSGFSGSLGDLAMYNTALATDRVQAHSMMANGKTISYGRYGDALLADGPVAYWQLGEVCGNGAINIATNVVSSNGVGDPVNGRHQTGVTVGAACAGTQRR